MTTKAFVLLLVAVAVLGGGIGAVFAGGVAVGKSQGQKAVQTNLPAQSTPGSGQQFRQQFQGQAGQAGSQGFAGRSGISGTIDKIEGNTVTVTTAQGPLQATIGADTTIQMVAKGTSQDLRTGLRVTVVGQRGADGAVIARSILVTPEGIDLLGGGSLLGGSQ